MDHQPRQPGREAFQFDFSQLRHAGGAANGGERALISIPESRAGLASGPQVQLVTNQAGGMPGHLHGRRGHPRDRQAVFPQYQRQIPNGKHFRVARQA